VDGEEAKAENPKHPGTKTPAIGNKGVASPNLIKGQFFLIQIRMQSIRTSSQSLPQALEIE
jgi:hypothetical protein